MVKPYEIIEGETIRLIDGPYKGRRYRYGKVDLVPSGDVLKLKFEYFLEDNIEGDSDFEHYIGEILHELIEQSLATHTTVYTGGTE